MKIEVKVGGVTKIGADLLAIGIFSGKTELTGPAVALDPVLKGEISAALKHKQIEGKLGEVLVLNTCGRIHAKRAALIGLGEEKKFDGNAARTSAATAVKEGKKLKAATVASALSEDFAKEVVEGAVLGNYKFKGYKKEDKDFSVSEFIIVTRDYKHLDVHRGEIVARAQNNARDLVNAPANKLTPTALAHYAQKMARSYGITCRIEDPKKLGFGAMLSVAEGSKEPAKVVVLNYHHGGKSETIGLAGKGITFDSGGISLKPEKKMWEMKTDMAGAAAVIETMRAAAELKLKKNIIAVIPLCENMPDGEAARPGDVVTSYSGKTIEIISTDAEGRMLLIDAVAYLKKLGAKKIVDVATLTGGCIIALGDAASGVMGSLSSEIIEASKLSGEKMWELPLFDEYKEYLKSDIADIKNSTDGRGASPSTGGIFVREGVGDIPWGHIDIAGTAFVKNNATGTPVRTLVQWLSL